MKDRSKVVQGLVLTLLNVTIGVRSQQALKESEVKYREAFEITNFYKELLAHDISNILNNILMSSELCALYLKDPENYHKLQEVMKTLYKEVLRGGNLISNVRKLSELEESKIPIQTTELCGLLKESIFLALRIVR